MKPRQRLVLCLCSSAAQKLRRQAKTFEGLRCSNPKKDWRNREEYYLLVSCVKAHWLAESGVRLTVVCCNIGSDATLQNHFLVVNCHHHQAPTMPLHGRLTEGGPEVGASAKLLKIPAGKASPSTCLSIHIACDPTVTRPYSLLGTEMQIQWNYMAWLCCIELFTLRLITCEQLRVQYKPQRHWPDMCNAERANH
ncbi:hypothetical protein F5B22DRAFT_314886 [Xylaria bambusicola]|uniref:uncharacterized protein n=1 Tax=Xylaria bambusicola TaxID=326684 RepID=UPI002008B5C1|nr:uncharacterized protein F5B22DRAFT_314886 [Xylaria bambusicola]KAI0509754.1 hypothetical protein F5B22DRAFT_314886 [Xylaria bambusicola]